MNDRCQECGSWGVECGSDKPVADCSCARCANARADAYKGDRDAFSALAEACRNAKNLPCFCGCHWTPVGDFPSATTGPKFVLASQQSLADERTKLKADLEKSELLSERRKEAVFAKQREVSEQWARAENAEARAELAEAKLADMQAKLDVAQQEIRDGDASFMRLQKITNDAMNVVDAAKAWHADEHSDGRKTEELLYKAVQTYNQIQASS